MSFSRLMQSVISVAVKRPRRILTGSTLAIFVLILSVPISADEHELRNKRPSIAYERCVNIHQIILNKASVSCLRAKRTKDDQEKLGACLTITLDAYENSLKACPVDTGRVR